MSKTKGKDFWLNLVEEFEKIPLGICTVCGHKLNNHMDEGDGWRCHSLAQDFLQCECWLRKGRLDGDVEAYDLRIRLLDNSDLSEFKEKVLEKKK